MKTKYWLVSLICFVHFLSSAYAQTSSESIFWENCILEYIKIKAAGPAPNFADTTITKETDDVVTAANKFLSAYRSNRFTSQEEGIFWENCILENIKAMAPNTIQTNLITGPDLMITAANKFLSAYRSNGFTSQEERIFWENCILEYIKTGGTNLRSHPDVMVFAANKFLSAYRGSAE